MTEIIYIICKEICLFVVLTFPGVAYQRHSGIAFVADIDSWLQRQVTRKIKLATLNVGSMTGRSGEVVHLMARKNLQVLCVQRRNGEGVRQERLVLDTSCTTTGRMA